MSNDTTTIEPTGGGKIDVTNITTEMKNCYIDYAMSVIVGRALPDVRDGLKPVHRRILYAMQELGLYPDQQFRKSVRIVGDVLGKFHPHGDTSVYDALVRMAQDFSMRYPTVKGHGNFGSIDGDSAAAMRYTEAKMDYIAQEMLRDINKNTVDFVDNFDGSETEPEVLTARFPHLLVNGSQGIAVGMATNMPPHNLGEVIDATIAYIDNPNIDVSKLMEYMPGPDFPTGGIILGSSGIEKAYRKGRGRIRVRGVAEIVPEKKGKNAIIITELPYNANKAKLVERIAKLKKEKIIDGIVDVRDESDLKQGIRIVVEVKKGVDPNYVLNGIYSNTELEDTFGIINLALVPDEEGSLAPKVLSLPEILEEYIKHQKQVIIRRTQFDLDKAERRAHILEGLLIALDNIDEVVEIIRSSKDGKTANKRLQERFELDEVQAQAILDMRLQRLTGLERQKLQKEYDELEKLIEKYKKILSDEKEVLKVIKKELREIKKKYGDERRTQIGEAEETVSFVVPERKVYVTFTQNGYLNSTERPRKITDFDGELIVKNIEMTNLQSLVFVTNKGRAYRLGGDSVPDEKGKGSHIKSIFNMSDDEKVVNTLLVKDFDAPDAYLVLATKKGLIKRVELKEFNTSTKTGTMAAKLRKGDELKAAFLSDNEEDQIIAASRDGFILRTELNSITPTGKTSSGVKLMDFADDEDEVVGVTKADNYVVTVTDDGYAKSTKLKDFRLQKRNTKGLKSVHSVKDKLVGMVAIPEPQDGVIILTDDGVVEASDLPVLSRTKQGEKKTDKKVTGLIRID